MTEYMLEQRWVTDPEEVIVKVEGGRFSPVSGGTLTTRVVSNLNGSLSKTSDVDTVLSVFSGPYTITKMSDDDEQTVEKDFTIAKFDNAQQNVFGWAYVSFDKEGNVVVDKSGEFVDDVEELEKTAYHFVLKSRASDNDHTNVQTGEMIESIVFTPEKIEKMGLPEGSVPLGWWVGFHIDDKDVWSTVESGERSAFSIHGSGTRKEVTE